jgi:hypothetical protein
VRDIIAKKGAGDLSQLLRAGDTWEVNIPQTKGNAALS